MRRCVERSLRFNGFERTLSWNGSFGKRKVMAARLISITSGWMACGYAGIAFGAMELTGSCSGTGTTGVTLVTGVI
ncbi:hypothetical protein GCM10022212_13700 [Actimicrobium antarcticum]|uniref:Uncharacterized protein n=1 Tax=Actimicrobium antarcticum TaxID=1051899 RepID=A0ABP7T0H2_9BURK